MSNRKQWTLRVMALVPAAVVMAAAAQADLTARAVELRRLVAAGQWDEALKLAKPAARWPDHANGSEGLLQTNTPILLDWDVCAPRGGTNPAPVLRPVIERYPWLEFAPATNGLTATLHLTVDSWPRTTWRIRLQQVDRAGAFVVVRRKVEKTIENSGTIERVPFLESLEATLPLDGPGEWSTPRGALFQISLETLWTEQGNPLRWGEAKPLFLDLPTAEQSRVFKAESLTLTKAGASVQAVVQAEVISWPKSRWRLALELSNDEGKPIGRAEHVVENIGEIISRPSWSRSAFQFAVPSEFGALGRGPPLDAADREPAEAAAERRLANAECGVGSAE